MQEATTIATLLTSATSTISTALTSVWDIIVSNPITALSAGAGVLVLGFAIFEHAKNVAK